MKPHSLISSWQTLRDHFTKDAREGSVGYLVALNKASEIFVALNDGGFLLDSDKACKEFNSDKQLGEALVMSPALKEIGVIQ